MQSAEDEFGALHEWINKHLSDDLSLAMLADQAGMSERSFSRHYAGATGVTPARAIERLRVEAARRLLSESRLPVKRISQRCGFGSEETMRRSFLRVLSATPKNTAPVQLLNVVYWHWLTSAGRPARSHSASRGSGDRVSTGQKRRWLPQVGILRSRQREMTSLSGRWRCGELSDFAA
jgi:AraC-like DNA-binding protein